MAKKAKKEPKDLMYRKLSIFGWYFCIGNNDEGWLWEGVGAKRHAVNGVRLHVGPYYLGICWPLRFHRSEYRRLHHG